jgi:hypothetical protein
MINLVNRKIKSGHFLKSALTKMSIDALESFKGQPRRLPRTGSNGMEHATEIIASMEKIMMARVLSGRTNFGRRRLVRLADDLLKTLERKGTPGGPMNVDRMTWKEATGDPDLFWNKYVRNPHPVVLEGFDTDLWGWSVKHLSETYGDHQTGLINMDTGGYESRHLRDLEDPSGKYYYANSHALWREHPHLEPDLGFENLGELLPSHGHLSTSFFAGCRAGQPVIFHHDGTVATFVLQVEGRKRWRQVDPFFAPLMYPVMRPQDCYSAVRYLDDADRAAMPLLKFVPYYDTVLKPGEILWNPSYMFHSVRNLDPRTLAVSTRWMTMPGRETLDPWKAYTRAHMLSPYMVRRRLEAMRFEEANNEVEGTSRHFNWYDAVSHNRVVPMTRAQVLLAWGIQPTPELLKMEAL